MRFKHAKRSAMFAFLGAAVLWLLTATWGISDVESKLDHNARHLNQSLGPLTRIEFDPDELPPKGGKKVPWYYIGHASSPFPLIVVVDFAYAVAPGAGQRSRLYVFWLFGFQYSIHQRVAWFS